MDHVAAWACQSGSNPANSPAVARQRARALTRASLALAGTIYHFYPGAAATRLARVHFWMHNLGLPVFMAGLALVLSQHEWAMPLTVVGAITVLLGLFVFAANVLLHTKVAAAAP